VTFQPNPGPGGQPTDAQRLMLPVRQDAAVQGAFLTQAFFWMFVGLLLSAAVGLVVRLSPQVLEFAVDNWLLVFFGQLALVAVISFGIRRISATVALGLFFVYAASVGFTVLAISLAVYSTANVATAFLSASAMFGGAALYGYTTKRSLAGVGAIAMMGLFGLIVAIIVNVFVGSSTISLIISVIGVVVFTALTAWDVQRISSGQLVAALGSVEKAAVIGALNLYLDFINLFLFLLRIMGDRRR
jgi:FtsH-binding integral membrane protein